jgi:hypothetical protein
LLRTKIIATLERLAICCVSAPKPDGSTDVWRDGPAQYCVWTKPAGEGKLCQADLQVKYGAHPVLPSALGQWVEMSYRVEADRSGRAVIEVYADGLFIVRVKGKIGYDSDSVKRSLTKFKIGHYRDYMPFCACHGDRLAEGNAD